jgi:nicotinamide-nucleotide adenylyltransferase
MEELSSGAKVQLTFLLGYDTLERLFAVKYYGSEENMKQSLRKFLSSQCGDGSRIRCATRSTGASYSQVNKTILQTAAEYIDTGAVVITELEETHQALSSSEVRQDVLAGSVGWEAKVPGTVSNYIREKKLYKTS